MKLLFASVLALLRRTGCLSERALKVFFVYFYSRLRYIKQVSGVIGLQTAQLVLSATIGFLIIRTLNKETYAMFSLLNVGMATLSGWAVSPITGIFIPFAQRMSATATLNGAASEFRRINRPMLWVGISVAIVFIFYSARINNWTSVTFSAAATAAIATAICQYSCSYIQAILKQSGRPVAAMAITVMAEVLRCVLIAVAVSFIFESISVDSILLSLSLITLAVAAITLHASQRKSGKIASTTTLSETVREEARSEYWILLRPIFFPMYFFLTVQLFKGGLIYLVSDGGTIAEVAALGRLMMLISLVDKTIEYVVLPKLGASIDHEEFKNKFKVTLIVIFTILVIIVASAWVFPVPWLLLLGKEYPNLEGALFWTVAAACTERLSGFLMFSQYSRGITRNQWWIPVFSFLAYFGFVGWQGLSTAELAGQALFVYATVQLLGQAISLGWNLRQISQK